jgi:hypothetical protein
MAIFNMGVSDAYAEEAKANETITETNKIETVDAVVLQCNMQSTVTIVATLGLSSQSSFSLIEGLMYRECEPRTIERDDGSIVVISSDCKIAIVPAPTSN